MKTTLLRALAAHDARTTDGFPKGGGLLGAPARGLAQRHEQEAAPDSRRGMCGADCGGSPCSRDANHDGQCSPEGDPPTDLRAIVRAELDRRGPGALVMLAAALRGRWGKSQKSRVEQLSRWLNGGRTDARASIPLYAFEAVLDVLGLSVGRR
jgi:hypothetical protein